MKIICFIVVLTEITKKVHSLKCSLGTFDPTSIWCSHDFCETGPCRFCQYCYADKLCSITELDGKVDLGCMPEGPEAGCTERMVDGEMRKTCYCQEDECNFGFNKCLSTIKVENCTQGDATEECAAKCIPVVETTTIQTTAGTTKNNQNSTENDALGTSKVDQNSTEDSTRATSEDNQQSTDDGTEATVENVKETPKPTGKPVATSGNQRAVELNQLVSLLRIIVTLII